MINSVTIAGNMTREVELKRTQSGMPVASFGVAVNKRRKDPQTGEWRDEPNFFDVVAFGERWEKLAPYMPKGTKVTVQGELRQSRWQDKNTGQNRSKVEIVAAEVELPPKQKGQAGQPPSQQPDAGYTSVYDSDCPF